MEKTELEKRWESEAVHETDQPVKKEVSEGNTFKGIGCPLVQEGVFVPMGIISVGPKAIIGGIVEICERTCIVIFPMTYVEAIVSRDAASTEMQIQFGTQKIYHALDIPDEMQFVYDSIYLMKNDSANDMRVVGAYESMAKAALSAKYGIVAPTAQDMANVTKIR